MTRGRKIFAWTAAILVLLLAILIIVIATFDWNRLKPTINEKVSAELHRPFAINGNLAVLWRREPEEGGWRAWVPWPHLSAEDIALGNPEWSKNPQMVTLKRVELRLSPLPLLAQRVVIPRIDLTEPNARIERLADGRANWVFDLPKSDPNAEPSSWVVDIGSIGFDKGFVSYNDQMINTAVDVVIDPLGKPIPFSDIVGSSEARRFRTKAPRRRTTHLVLPPKASITDRSSTVPAKWAACWRSRTQPCRSRCRRMSARAIRALPWPVLSPTRRIWANWTCG